MTRTSGPAGIAEVRILDAPVRVWTASTERYQDLMREFTLLQFGHERGQDVPARLLTLSEQISGQFAGLTAPNNARRDAAYARGQDRIDLTYSVPAEFRQACEKLLVLLDEVDEYCRADHLLTLATPPTQVAFRRWYLGEFIAQIDGQPPRAWDGPLVCEDDELLQPQA